IWMGGDAEILAGARTLLPKEWSLTEAASLEEFSDWQEILLHRFLVLNLEEGAVEEPVEVVLQVRQEYQLNIPIFCYGGNQEIRMEARSARADRFFEREEILEKLPDFLRQFSW
ncbi:MAG: hypothetical protein K0041_05060, partial [Acidithiobacillus sp.]|nr:hypothetical protein [Acidithiobacillus sp.]